MLILMFILKFEEIDKVLGFELGVDDYMIKFFGIWEFQVCVKVLFCCMDQWKVLVQKEGEYFLKLQFGDLGIDLDKRKVMINNECVDFFLKEFELLLFLVFNFGKSYD